MAASRRKNDFGQLRTTKYAETKFKFDTFLQENEKSVGTNSKGAIRVLTIHPGYILGRWDSKPSSGFALIAIRMGRIKKYVEGEKNFVAASDVAQGIWQALETNQTGRFILGGHNIKVSSFIRAAAQELNVTPPTTQITMAELETVEEPQRSFLREFCASGPVSSEKAKLAFGYEPKLSVAEIIKEAVDYFTEMKTIRRSKSATTD